MSNRLGGPQGRFWRHCFLRRFRAQVRPIAGRDSNRWSKEARRQAEEIYDAQLTAGVDRKGHMIQMMCSHILAAYRVVRDKTGDATLAFSVAKDAMEQTLRRPMNFMVRMFLKLYRDPVSKLSRMNLAAAGQKNYGDTMLFDEERGENHVDMLVRRCAFHQFFVDHGVPGLTLTLCNWDRNWMQLLDNSKRPVRAERPSTISTGGECCRFRFVRDERKDGPPTVDIVLDSLTARQTSSPDVTIPTAAVGT
jgi:L-2-amino-thiazoline-4-carboxylic acid hydrolase-like protein